MQIVKKKSLVVALVSSLIIAVVLILTLISYIVYLEIKDRERKASYEHRMGELRTR